MTAAASDPHHDALLFLALVSVGTAIGSVMRDRIVHGCRARFGRADLGILASNLAACAGCGLALPLEGGWHAFVVLGLAGGLSTWSSLAVDVAGSVRAGRWSRVVLHVPAAFALALAVFLAARVLHGAPA